MAKVLFGTASGRAANILAAGPFDLVVTDQIAFAGAVAGQALGIPWATVAVTPLSLISADLPPVGAPWTPATGPAGRLRDAGIRMLSRAVCRLMDDPKLNQLRAEVGLAWWPDLAAARTVVHVTQGTLDVDPGDLLKPAIASRSGPSVDRHDATAGRDPAVGQGGRSSRPGRDPDPGVGARTGTDAQADDGIGLGQEPGVERNAPARPDPQAEGAARVGRDPWTGPGAPARPHPQAEDDAPAWPGLDMLVVCTIGSAATVADLLEDLLTG